MNGKLGKYRDQLIVLVNVIAGIGSAIGLAFFVVLGISGLLIRVPEGFGKSWLVVVKDYYRLVVYLVSFQSNRFSFLNIPISKGGSDHFSEVQWLIHEGLMFLIVALVIFCWSFWKLKKRSQLWQLTPLYWQGLILLVVVAVMSIVSFNDTFLWFHYRVFSNTDWIFNPRTDPIILILNDHFFGIFFVCWVIISVILILLIIGFVKRLINFFVRSG